jgi:hemolysin-activating ACP:hemolysin acyltransferase
MSLAKAIAARDPSATRQSLQILRPAKPVTSLGLAVNYLMTKPAFANLKFGDWSRILVGQINRGHFCFVIDADREIQGFMGWALATSACAESWLAGRRALTFEDSTAGDCMVINAWAANSTTVTRFMMQEARRISRDLTAVYFKRHYEDGSTRAVRVPVNEFVGSHIERSGQVRSEPASASPMQ